MRRPISPRKGHIYHYGVSRVGEGERNSPVRVAKTWNRGDEVEVWGAYVPESQNVYKQSNYTLKHRTTPQNNYEDIGSVEVNKFLKYPTFRKKNEHGILNNHVNDDTRSGMEETKRRSTHLQSGIPKIPSLVSG